MEMIMLITLVLCFFIGAFLLITRKSQSGKEKVVQSKPSKQGFKSYTKAEVSLHNKRTDCWVIIKDKVYDVSSYVEEHPGGDAILRNAGDDSTEGFYGPQHGTGVFQLIEDFCIGDLKQ
ncbi:Cytochrome b5-like heme/steroid binding domain [Dillenia turbinata]|uniref:Cytochrome b5-like heme/steroid binding domain n=1 Tax=Dillenia turbinata TaxID=194707 RepID=A0AAN8ZKK5_9MAGN